MKSSVVSEFIGLIVDSTHQKYKNFFNAIKNNDDKTKIGETHSGAQQTFKFLFQLTEVFGDIVLDGYEYASCFLYLTSSIIYFNDSISFYSKPIYNLYHLSCMMHHFLWVKIVNQTKKTNLIGAVGSVNTATFWIQMPIFCNKFKLPPLYFTDRKHERSYQAWARIVGMIRNPRPIREIGEYQNLGKFQTHFFNSPQIFPHLQ